MARPPSRPTLTIAELLRLSDNVPARYGALILVGGVLGLRWGEAIGLRVRDVDFLRRTITVAQEVSEVTGHLAIEPPKTARSVRTLAVPPFVIEAITAHLVTHRGPVGPDDLVFLGPKGGVLRRAFEQRTFKPAVASAGLPSTLTFHGLRHVAATIMVANNEHPRVIQHRLGHTDPTRSRWACMPTFPTTRTAPPPTTCNGSSLKLPKGGRRARPLNASTAMRDLGRANPQPLSTNGLDRSRASLVGSGWHHGGHAAQLAP